MADVDIANAQSYSSRCLKFLRSSLFIAIVSLFVLTGYAHEVFGDCCAHHIDARQEQNGKTPAGLDECQCLCHQIISPIAPEPVRVTGAVLPPEEFATCGNEFPPDAVPLGIEVPPQLA